MSDGLTMGVCTGGACVRTYTIPGNGARTGTGTISSSGAAVTGSGTAFTSELHVGDAITASGQTQTVSSILSDTSLLTAFGFAPVISAGTAFTYTNPVVRFLDGSGNTVAILSATGELALGQPYTLGVLALVGQNATGDGAVASSGVIVNTGNGGSSTVRNGGKGADIQFTAGNGGSTTAGGFQGGNGGQITYTAGSGGQGPSGGVGASAFWQAGSGGNATASGGTGGPGAGAYLLGGAGGSAVSGATNGAGGAAVISGGAAGSGAGGAAAAGDTIVGLVGGITKIGTNAQTQVNNATGDVTKIKNVPVAGLWNVNAFQQANAGGL